MFVANDKNGKRVDIDQACPGETYFCPDCDAELIQRRGDIKLHHFAHKSLGDCVAPREPMTEWHLNWQRMFPEDCREVTVFDEEGNKRRADVRVGRCVLEFQHSSISSKDWWARSEFYVEQGLQPIWVYDRRGCDPRYDLIVWGYRDVSKGLGYRPAVGKEFIRAGKLDQYCPVVLDYGPFCMLCCNFYTDLDHDAEHAQGECGNVFMLDREMFSQLINELADDPLNEWGDPMDCYDLIWEREELFVAFLRKYFGWSKIAKPMLDRIGKYVISTNYNDSEVWEGKHRCLGLVRGIESATCRVAQAMCYDSKEQAQHIIESCSRWSHYTAQRVGVDDVVHWLLLCRGLWSGSDIDD